MRTFCEIAYLRQCHYKIKYVFTIGCTLYAFGVGQFGLVSIVTLSSIAVERYLVITAKPLSGSWKLTRQGAMKVSGIKKKAFQ